MLMDSNSVPDDPQGTFFESPRASDQLQIEKRFFKNPSREHASPKSHDPACGTTSETTLDVDLQSPSNLPSRQDILVQKAKISHHCS